MSTFLVFLMSTPNNGLEPMLIETPECYTSGEFRHYCYEHGIREEDADMESILASKINPSQSLYHKAIDETIKYVERIIEYIKTLTQH